MPADLQSAPFGHSGNLPCRASPAERNSTNRREAPRTLETSGRLRRWTHAGAPDIDIVFVHGIRGGPFVTWRRVRTPKTLDPRTGSLQVAAPEMRHELCWPTIWLKADVPGARLLSLEYAAPASGWEVKHPFYLQGLSVPEALAASPSYMLYAS